MKLIFIRHGEPDYNIDSLTENGWKEAKALANRVAKWNVSQFYVSPLGRAKDTASFSLKATGKEAIELDFMREYSYPILDKTTGRNGVAWDFVPSDWTNAPYMFELDDAFLQFPCIQENKDLKENYYKVINGFDELLKSYGYIREGKYYRNINGTKRYVTSTVDENNHVTNLGLYHDGEKEPTLVIFCHLGVTCLVLSHLLNIPFETIAHGFFMPTTSVTVLSTEERWDTEAYFRVQQIGDTRHLYEAGIPVSPAGSFSDPFQE